MDSKRTLLVFTSFLVFRIIIGLILYTTISCSAKIKNSFNIYSDSNPQIFEKDIISTNSNHEGLSYISANKDEIIFTRSSKDFKTSQILYSSYKNGTWSTPKTLNLTNSGYEAGFVFSPKKKQSFFTNKTPIIDKTFKDEWNIWQINTITTQDYDMSSAKPIESPINSDSMDCCLTMNSKGTVLFSSNREGTWDIYEAKYNDGSFNDLKKLGTHINSSKSDEWPSYISEDENTIFFSSIRKDGFGGDDLYYTLKENGKWSQSKIFRDNFNSNSYEDGAFITTDNKFFFFSSWKTTSFSNDVSNIYIWNIKNELLYE